MKYGVTYIQFFFHIYEAYKQGIQLNEVAIEPHNPIYEIIIKNQTSKSLFTTYNQIQPHLPDSPLPSSNLTPHSPFH
jgi:hypothetical protein